MCKWIRIRALQQRLILIRYCIKKKTSQLLLQTYFKVHLRKELFVQIDKIFILIQDQ